MWETDICIKRVVVELRELFYLRGLFLQLWILSVLQLCVELFFCRSFEQNYSFHWLSYLFLSFSWSCRLKIYSPRHQFDDYTVIKLLFGLTCPCSICYLRKCRGKFDSPYSLRVWYGHRFVVCDKVRKVFPRRRPWTLIKYFPVGKHCGHFNGH